MIAVKKLHIDHRAVLAAVVFAAVLAVLGFRSQQAAEKMLAPESAGGAAVVTTGGDPHGLQGLARRDSLLLSADAERNNPFFNPDFVRDVAHKHTAMKTQTPAPEKPVEPRLLTLLHDDVKPCVQIGVADVRSGWLHTGDSFKGWSVGEIARGSVTLVKRGRTLVLR